MEKTNEKRNLMKRIMLMLCAAVVAISTVLGSGVTEVQAASKAKKAMAAYAKFLADESKWGGRMESPSFGLIDVNKDGIKELVVDDDDFRCTNLYGYSSGKVTELGTSSVWNITFYPQKKIFCCGDYEGEIIGMSYCKYNGKKVKEIAGYAAWEEKTYTVKGGKTSEKNYNKYIKSLHLGKGISSAKINKHKNTKENRKRYLK